MTARRASDMQIERLTFTWTPLDELADLAGDVVDALWKALDYVAFKIYRVAGGASDGGGAGDVAFPIVKTEPDDWGSVVGRKVPGVWPEAADALKAAQPFSQEGEEVAALPTLQALSRTDKHRNLALCAAAAFSGSAIWPGGSGLSVSIQLARSDGSD